MQYGFFAGMSTISGGHGVAGLGTSAVADGTISAEPLTVGADGGGVSAVVDTLPEGAFFLSLAQPVSSTVSVRANQGRGR